MAGTTQLISTKKEKNVYSMTTISSVKGVMRGSVKKISRALDVIRAVPVGVAMNFLFYSDYSCARDVAKLIKSALANSIDRGEISQDDFNGVFVKEAFVSTAFALRRMKSASRGRSSPRKKRFSNVTISLGIELEPDLE